MTFSLQVIKTEDLSYSRDTLLIKCTVSASTENDPFQLEKYRCGCEMQKLACVVYEPVFRKYADTDIDVV